MSIFKGIPESMLEDNKNDPVEKLLQLQHDFKRKLPEKISEIEICWRKLRAEKPPNFTALHLKTHSLIGSAGTFGADRVSIAARKLENEIKLLLNKGSILDDDAIERIEYIVIQLHDISNKWQPSSIPFVPEKRIKEKTEDLDWQSNIYLVEDDEAFAKPLIEYLEKAGYTVFYYKDIKEFDKSYNTHERASAILMDMAFEEGITAGAKTIKNLSEQDNNFPPVIFISVHDDIQARLAAAQAGAKRYFTKPIDQPKLIRSLDNLTHRMPTEPYRVLMIDDDEDVLDYYSENLKEHGIDVLSFSNPIDTYQSIESFNPELIVLDLYMPECSGFDFATVIRQDDGLAYIPIVFLSSELDAGTQLAAMDLGGDDFLMKPVDVDYFVQAVLARVKRSRHVNKLNTNIKDALRESEYRLITLDQHAIISMTDTAGTIIFANQHFEKISGYNADELLGKSHNILKSGRHPKSFYDDMWKTISSGNIWRGQICNRSKKGSQYWVESTIVPFMDENGLPYKYVSVRTDITKVKQSEEDAQVSEKRLIEQRETLNTLSTITDYILLEETVFFNIVTMRAAETLNIDRVSIWMLDKKHTELTCRKLYERKANDHGSGTILKRDDFPKYFSALENNTVISAVDAHSHPATSEFSESYHTPLGIDAMLGIPIRKQGRVIGVICCEHIGGQRNWRSDEQGFVSGLSDLVSLNLESSERKIVEMELAEAIKKADDANNAKSEFLSSMSHELRTPMNAIAGFAQLLLMGREDNLNEVQKSNVNEILHASDHLLELINEILNLAKIEAGTVELSIETVSFPEVIAECLSLMSTMIEKRKIKVRYQLNGREVAQNDVISSKVFMHVDRMRFKQIILNLLSNSVKYNIDEGDVIIACDVLNDIARISISDSGKGISKEGQDDLFKSFNRLGQENGNIEGTGIGLVITAKLVELMGGNIGMDSELNKGSTFWVEFPRVDVIGIKNIETTANNDVPEKELEKEYSVLYIEDNPANLRLVEQVLSSKDNINMISAHEPHLGLELANSKNPDLILLDINLPGMNGFEVLKKLRASDKTKNIPVFAVSANAMLNDIEKGMREGFDDYITKPIDVATFFVKVIKVLKIN